MINNHNLENPALDFPQSISHNLAWVKKIAVEHDCSSVLAACAALMTMTMMDHHKMGQAMDQMQNDLNELKDLCRSNSLPDHSKESL